MRKIKREIDPKEYRKFAPMMFQNFMEHIFKLELVPTFMRLIEVEKMGFRGTFEAYFLGGVEFIVGEKHIAIKSPELEAYVNAGLNTVMIAQTEIGLTIASYNLRDSIVINFQSRDLKSHNKSKMTYRLRDIDNG